MTWLQDVLKNPELMAEFSRLMEKMQKGIQYPAPRNESRILPRLPESTLFYAAFPNYGEALHQALQIFEEGLKDSPNLQEFMKKNKIDILQPQFAGGIEKFYQFSQFLGDEIIITGRFAGKEPSLIAVAELKKPGARQFLEKLNEEVFSKQSDPLPIFDPQQLALAAREKASKGAPVVLIRPDVIAVSSSVASLKDFNAYLDQAGPKFTSNALGQRVAQSYRSGATTLIGVDLHQVIAMELQGNSKDKVMLEQTGLADVQYLLAESTLSAAGSSNQLEVVFSGPRRGVVSWIAAPAPMDGLGFVSANAASASDIILKNPAEIFEQVGEIFGPSAFASLPQMEAQLHVNLKQDVLSKLTGEIASEMRPPERAAAGSAADRAAAARQGIGSYKFILGVSDPEGLQQSLTRLLAVAPMQRGQREEDGVIFNTLTMPAGEGVPAEFNYFFMDGYLIVSSDRAMALDAVRAHRTGNSLAKSSALRDSLAAGQSAHASAIWYQDAGQMFASMLSRLPQEFIQLLPTMGEIKSRPTVFTLYADSNTLRAMTNFNLQAGVGLAAIGAAIAIPSLSHARTGANEAAAASNVRTINVAEVTYATMYEAKGYAPALAVLGIGAADDCSEKNVSAAHACLLDRGLGNPSCAAGKWCEKNGYKFSVRGVCGPSGCRNYVVTATPAEPEAGGKSFCSMNDGVIRVHAGPALQVPLTVAECRAWAPQN